MKKIGRSRKFCCFLIPEFNLLYKRASYALELTLKETRVFETKRRYYFLSVFQFGQQKGFIFKKSLSGDDQVNWVTKGINFVNARWICANLSQFNTLKETKLSQDWFNSQTMHSNDVTNLQSGRQMKIISQELTLIAKVYGPYSMVEFSRNRSGSRPDILQKLNRCSLNFCGWFFQKSV